MKAAILAIRSLVPLCAALSVQAQGTFRNLNFEQARIIPLGGGPPVFVATTNAIPGWIAYQGGFQPGSIMYNALSLGASDVSIHDTNDPYASYYGGVIQGKYTVLLQPEYPGATNASAAIGQVGLIPATAQSV